MPEYNFRCIKCNAISTYELGMEEERPTRCKKMYDIPLPKGFDEDWTAAKQCNGELIRLFTVPHVVYRSGGFQATDKRLEPTEDDFDE